MEAVMAGCEHLAAIPLPPTHFSKVSKGGEKPGTSLLSDGQTVRTWKRRRKRILKSERTTLEYL
jgi:hypothetical protein